MLWLLNMDKIKPEVIEACKSFFPDGGLYVGWIKPRITNWEIWKSMNGELNNSWFDRECAMYLRLSI